MHGLMMDDFQLTIGAILRRAERHFGHKSIASRRTDRSVHRYTYAECIARARRLAVALRDLGVREGDRVATFCWNHHQHLEAYYGISASGAVLHTLNIRLHPDELTFIANHAADTVAIVDKVLWPAFEKWKDRAPFKHVICVADDGVVPPGTIEYESLLAGADVGEYDFPEVDEKSACVMCYTSGTTGNPKGVLYSHRAIVLHTLGCGLADSLGGSERDTILPVVPMFHANAWGIPYLAAMVGSTQVHPGPHLDPKSLVELMSQERVTISCGVPTIWLGVLAFLDANPGAYDLSSIEKFTVGGAAPSEALLRAFEERHGITMIQGWGMTELTPVGSLSKLTSDREALSHDEKVGWRAKQGMPLPFVEVRARGEDGLVPWDGQTFGELEVRGPWVVREYYECPEGADRFTDDGWFRTGDIVTIERDGFLAIVDRSKDLVKSGGEWISSVALENALGSHPDLAEAVVIAVPHPKWMERPIVVAVAREGKAPELASIHAHLDGKVARWWLPDAIELVDAIPKTGTGKYMKTVLRQRYHDRLAAGDVVPAGAPVAEATPPA